MYITETRLVVRVTTESCDDFEVGESLAINGVCLTISELASFATETHLYFDLSPETRQIVAPFEGYVHVERAMRHDQRYGGHYVSGHVWGTGDIVSIDRDNLEMKVTFPRAPLSQYEWKHKDSITIHGVSVTIAKVLREENAIKIALIPHTLSRTIFEGIEHFPYCVNIEPNASQQKVLFSDDELMYEAMVEGEKGMLTAPPNPWVGAVLVDQEGAILARAHHRKSGTPHAERLLEYCDGDWTGCTLYVTLEPCHHTGRTCPCDEYLVKTKVKRVVVGIVDPDTRVAGQGIEKLIKAGIDVDLLNDDRVKHSLRSYLWHRSHDNRPYIVCKLAVTFNQSFMGKITSEAALRHAHFERAKAQMIVVGKNTELLDRPQLTVRHGWKDQIEQQPKKFVAQDRKDLTWCTQANPEVLQILVEGGPTLQNALLEAGLVNEFVLYTATSKRSPKDEPRWSPSSNCSFALVEQQVMTDGSGDIMQRYLIGESKTNEQDDEALVVWSSAEEAKSQLLRGGMVIVMDDESRENEGDLMMLASRATRGSMEFIIRHTTGIVCVAINPQRAKELKLSRLNHVNGDKFETPFTISVDHCTTHTGVSAEDRSRTARALASASTDPLDLQRPGHMFPLISNIESGRRGHTEAGVAIAQMVGENAMILAELYDSDSGEMMRIQDCAKFAKKHNLPLLRMADILPLVEPAAAPAIVWCNIPTSEEDMWQLAMIDGHRVLKRTPFDSDEIVLRIHSDCWTGDTLGSMRCDCGEQLHVALHGGQCNLIIFPPNHEGRGIGLANKIEAYNVQQTKHVDTYRANMLLGHGEDERVYSGICPILRKLGCPAKLKLITCNPAKECVLREGGFDVEAIALCIAPSVFNSSYLATKQQKFAQQRQDKKRVVIIQAQWHASYSDQVVSEVKRLLETDYGVEIDRHVKVPGCWEILHEISENCDPKKDVILAIGILLKGETIHFEEIAREVNSGLRELIVRQNFAIVNSVLVCLSEDQITNRCKVEAEKCVSKGMTEAIMHYL